MRSIPIASFPTDESTTFENILTENGRVQFIRHVRPAWITTRSRAVASPGYCAPGAGGAGGRALFGAQFRGFSDLSNAPGLMRGYAADGRVFRTEWPEAPFVLERPGRR